MKNLLFILFIAGLLLAGCTTEPTIITIPPPEKAAPVTQKEPPAIKTQNRYIAGYSRQSRPIEYYVFGKGPDVTFVLGGIHGNEPASAVLASQLIKYLQANPSVLKNRKVVVLPRANPDGLANNSRFNNNGVDINRNFFALNRLNSPENGFSALSEPESKAIERIISSHSPRRIISLHQPYGCIDYDGPGDKLAYRMAQYSSLPVKKLGAKPGSLGSYAGLKLGVPIITVELPQYDSWLGGEALWTRYGRMLLAGINWPQLP